MSSQTRRISGSLNSLEVLEIAVRLSNLSLAARELGVTQPSVSHHISVLEERLGQALFTRRNNRVVPTAGARRLAEAIASGLGQINEVWAELAAASDPNEVTIACSFGFADQWLMHRFSDLRRFMGSTQVRVITTDRLRNIDLSLVDVVITWNRDDVPARPYFPLIRDEVFPICSPAFLAAHPTCETEIHALDQSCFLHFDVEGAGFLTWSGWFARSGSKAPEFRQPSTFDAYPFLLQAVRRGEGVALGWEGLVDRSLADGEIVRLEPAVASRDASYGRRPPRLTAGPESSRRGRLGSWLDQAGRAIAGPG